MLTICILFLARSRIRLLRKQLAYANMVLIREVTVDARSLGAMDVAEVTNRQFADFVEATGYVTFAERPLPEADLAVLQQVAEYNIKRLQHAADSVAGAERAAIYESIQRIKDSSQFLGQTAGSIIFKPPEEELRSKNDITQWWRIDAAATWRAPDGLGSSWQDRLDHPVVNVTHEDATEYATWAVSACRPRPNGSVPHVEV